MLKHRSRNRENTPIVYHHAYNLNCRVTNGIQTVWLTESCFIAHFELDCASCTYSKASLAQPQDGLLCQYSCRPCFRKWPTFFNGCSRV